MKATIEPMADQSIRVPRDPEHPLGNAVGAEVPLPLQPPREPINVRPLAAIACMVVGVGMVLVALWAFEPVLALGVGGVAVATLGVLFAYQEA